ERAWLECVRRGEPNHVAVQIVRHIFGMTNLVESTRGKGFVNLFARIRRGTYELAGCHAIRSSASLSVDRIRKKVHEPDTIIEYLWRRNQRAVWRDYLRTIFHIEIRADYDFVAVTL